MILGNIGKGVLIQHFIALPASPINRGDCSLLMSV